MNTRYGPVQVQVTLAGSRITTVDVVKYPTQDRRDREINADALPVLNQEAISAQNARIDAVSGATYTSDGYIRSLQSALDRAKG
ncbi:FMN-binding protein [Kitasatospora sp. NPDC101157]|uniref:FMN-binding protein n=1 Tax=Kitasatospora sp. NPDC101157 TaxID=3364098 RepID=UPI003814BE6D